MYETNAGLDFFTFLWYHKRVKLGCNATVPHGFDSVIRSGNRGSPLPKKGDGNGEFLFHERVAE